MARSKKRARHITVGGVGFSWRATGNDGWISLTVWPTELDGPCIAATFGYHETRIPRGLGGVQTSAGDQIVITNRLVRRVILLAIERFGYDAARRGEQLCIPAVDREISIKDAVRANHA